MPKVTIAFGAALILTGLTGMFLAISSGAKPITSLIPAFIGLPLLICGLIAQAEKARKHAMHVAAALGTLGALGGLGNIARVAFSDAPVSPTAIVMTVIMTLLCAAFSALCVRSFIEARRRAKAG